MSLRLTFILLMIFLIIIVGLFIEKYVHESRADVIIAPPSIVAKVCDDIWVYNSLETTRAKILRDMTEEERVRYIDKPIIEHASTRIARPITHAMAVKEHLTTEPATFAYDTATDVANIAREFMSGSGKLNGTVYRIIHPVDRRVTCFIDDGTIFIRDLSP